MIGTLIRAYVKVVSVGCADEPITIPDQVAELVVDVWT
jgi:hypothetical protein